MNQWSGPIVGMTATPWRLSENERLDHLFDDLITGPQTYRPWTLRLFARPRYFYLLWSSVSLAVRLIAPGITPNPA